MSFGEAIKSCFQHYTSWKGRASRSEYWWFALFVFLVTLPLQILWQVTASAALMATDLVTLSANFASMFNWAYWLLIIVSLVLFLPGLSVLIRRLHDTDRSGGWYWIGLVPFVGGIILLVFMLLPSTPGPNRYDV